MSNDVAKSMRRSRRLVASADTSTPAGGSYGGVGRPLVSQYYYDPRTGQVVDSGVINRQARPSGE